MLGLVNLDGVAVMLNGKVIVLGSKGNVTESMRDENKRLESFVTMRANARNCMSYDGDAWQELRVASSRRLERFVSIMSLPFKTSAINVFSHNRRHINSIFLLFVLFSRLSRHGGAAANDRWV